MARNTQNAFDVVVIGSGLAGLTGANRLALAGHKVCILEQHYQLGGLATWFRRPGRELFDISLHGFPVGMKKTCRKYWSKPIADAIVQLKKIRFDNPQFKLDTTFDEVDFRRHMRDTFKIADATIDDFFKTIRGMNFFDDNPMTAGELFEQFFPGRNDVVRFLMEPIAYANGSSLDDPALTYAIVFGNFMSKGVFTFHGGTDWLIKEMRKVLRDNSVEVKRNTLVEKVLFDNGRVVGVRTAEGEEIRCHAVLSNANLLTTVNQFAGAENLPAEFVEDAKNVRLNWSSSQVYIGIKEGESVPFIGDLFFTSKHPTFDTDALTAFDTSSWTFSFYYPELRPHHNRYAIVASINSQWDDWANLTDEQYYRAKEDLCEKTLDWLANWIPDIRKKVSHIEAATPKTFYRYTLQQRGASFGTKFEGLKVSQSLPEKAPGLFHAGSVGIIMSGWLGTANYGVIVAAKIDEYLAKLAKQGVGSMAE